MQMESSLRSNGTKDDAMLRVTFKPVPAGSDEAEEQGTARLEELRSRLQLRPLKSKLLERRAARAGTGT